MYDVVWQFKYNISYYIMLLDETTTGSESEDSRVSRKGSYRGDSVSTDDYRVL